MTKKVAVIGMAGKKRTGKDEAFKAIQSKHPSAVRVAFADPLKQELAQACGVTLQMMESNKEAFRLGLQWWGTEFRRGLFGESYWIDRAREQFFKTVHHYKPTVVVFTDVRFPNEIQLIHELGGKVWRVYRPSAMPVGTELHPSETALDHHTVDRSLWNERDLHHYHFLVLDALRKDFGL